MLITFSEAVIFRHNLISGPYLACVLRSLPKQYKHLGLFPTLQGAQMYSKLAVFPRREIPDCSRGNWKLTARTYWNWPGATNQPTLFYRLSNTNTNTNTNANTCDPCIPPKKNCFCLDTNINLLPNIKCYAVYCDETFWLLTESTSALPTAPPHSSLSTISWHIFGPK